MSCVLAKNEQRGVRKLGSEPDVCPLLRHLVGVIGSPESRARFLLPCSPATGRRPCSLRDLDKRSCCFENVSFVEWVWTSGSAAKGSFIYPHGRRKPAFIWLMLEDGVVSGLRSSLRLHAFQILPHSLRSFEWECGIISPNPTLFRPWTSISTTAFGVFGFTRWGLVWPLQSRQSWLHPLR